MMYKQAIFVRKDLNMGKGKICAQVAHASLESALIVMRRNKKIFDEWRRGGAKKIVLKVDNLDEIYKIKRKADELGIVSVIIRDAGLTQLEEGTVTCIGLGPDLEEKIDKISKDYKLL